jgi:broad specificity phosphatase PhoE
MTTFFLIRHAHCDGVGNVLWGRKRDVHLNANGRSAARALARRIAQNRFEAIYSSPLERAVETAEEIAKRSNHVTVNVSEPLNELDFGEWTGESIESLDCDPVWQRFNSIRTRTPIPGGESILDAQVRIVDELKRLSVKHEDGPVAIVSHAEIIKIALAYFSNLDIDRSDLFSLPPCSLSLLALNGRHASVIAVHI